MSDYATPDRILHRLALSSHFMRRVAFDIDCAITNNNDSQVIAPTYIAGLARAGTTILLQTLYSTGHFTTLTYRNMPFVMAPRLWPQLSGRSRKKAEAKLRAHGDRLKVGYDSPEAFEEVFWIMATKGLFIDSNKLHPHKIQATGIADYRRFVANIVDAEQNAANRYLAKNNNNLLRLDSILEAFPDALIIVPFRNPHDHARSLLAQHVRFSAEHANEPFSLEYMNWLGHFEFGANHKPMGFAPASYEGLIAGPDTFDYWLAYWTRTYAHVAAKYAGSVFFFDYDAFCQDPAGKLTELAEFTNIDVDDLVALAADIETATRYAADDSKLPVSVRLVYDQLVSLTREQQSSNH